MIRFLIVASFLYGVFCNHVMLPPEWLVLVPVVIVPVYFFWASRR